mgnify:CR=1 FL=1
MNPISDLSPEVSGTPLKGKISLSALYVLMTVALIMSYIAYLFFPIISNISIARDVNFFGETYIPSVRGAMEISLDPTRCDFVMTIQWLFSILYIWIFFIYYNQFSKKTRIATKNWYMVNPLPSASNFRCVIFLLFGLASIFGDFGLLDFPTFFNGGIFLLDSNHFITQRLINSSLMLPVFSWFSVLAYIIIYWLCVFIIANRSIFFGQNES